MRESDEHATYLGIDLGTSGLKLSLVGYDGAVVAEAEAAYDVHSSRPGYAETDPDDWTEALSRALALLANRVEASGARVPTAMGVSGQMHGVVLESAQGRAVRPAILWPDRRAASSLPAWERIDADAKARLANPLSAGMAGPILGWLREHEGSALEEAALVRSPKDWLRAQLTGDRVTERSDASATLLWDVCTDTWSSAALSVAGVDRHQLPELVDSAAMTGEASWPWTSRSQAGAGERAVPVVAGGADAACAFLAVLTASGDSGRDSVGDSLVINVGTGVQLLRPRAEPTPKAEPRSHLYADTVSGWYEMVGIQNGGLALDWAQRKLGLDWAGLVEAARSGPEGASGIAFLPFVTGERGCVAPQEPLVGWIGDSPTSTTAERARTAFEALAFTIRRGLDLLSGAGSDTRLLITGGGVRDPWVRQLIANVLGRPLTYVPLRSASAVGAAILAARGVGRDLPVAANVVGIRPAPTPVLDQAFDRWQRLVDDASRNG